VSCQVRCVIRETQNAAETGGSSVLIMEDGPIPVNTAANGENQVDSAPFPPDNRLDGGTPEERESGTQEAGKRIYDNGWNLREISIDHAISESLASR